MILLNLVLIFGLSYLVGSFPTAIYAGKLLKGIDIREHGSGNAGGTNVLRVLGWIPGVAVILFDMLKGVFATLVVSELRIAPLAVSPVYLQIFAGASAVAGHIWSVFANFRGGKGVATALGLVIGLMPVAAGLCLVIFLTIAFATRYVSLASICASLALPAILVVFDGVFGREVAPPLLVISTAMALLILYTHRSNIKRLLRGEENRFGESA